MNNIILGINSDHADSSACIFVDGKLVAASEEERFNRIKHWSGFPIQSIQYCLEESGVSFNEISDITINTNPVSNLFPKLFFFLKKYISGKKKIEIFNRYKKKVNIKKKFFEKFGKSRKLKFHFIDHHKSHIASSFFPSGFKKSLAISIDGFGDFTSIAIADCENQNIVIKKKLLFPNSIGVFYEAMTQLAGFTKYGEEYKLMGLSAFGKAKYYEILKKNFFKKGNEILNLNLDLFDFHKKNFSYNYQGEPNQNLLFNSKALEIFKSLKIDNIKNLNFSKDIASSTQKIFEEFIQDISNKYQGDHENLVLSGGCALNSLANGKLAQKKKFKNIFVPYCPGDNGGCIGSALYLLNEKYPDTKPKNLQNPYLGKQYFDNDLLEFFKKYEDKVNVKEFKNDNELNSVVCNELINEKIIGWFQGRMEFGPRALGNRSIISSPIGPNIKDLINSKIKLRENFRPFAPSILEEKISDWFDEQLQSDYMSFVAPIKFDKRKIIPAVTHVDGTGRLQTVSKEKNHKFYNLIKKFEALTNVPILLNTSFNENEPIVMTPEEAIKCYLRTEMDFLVINNFFISKKI